MLILFIIGVKECIFQMLTVGFAIFSGSLTGFFLWRLIMKKKSDQSERVD